ncbi:---NA--- [Octopus vulgaris]|uniref:---NA n=1 Tax=Octopus vulgaris TaxID=6645 RepID=A0AA36C085_OCTVU|nr:---NA--- [Octopus vulgaris]
MINIHDERNHSTVISAVNHSKSIHKGDKLCHCDICGKSFSWECAIYTHKCIHTREKPFHCKRCGKSFSVEQYLTNYKYIHTGEKA